MVLDPRQGDGATMAATRAAGLRPPRAPSWRRDGATMIVAPSRRTWSPRTGLLTRLPCVARAFSWRPSWRGTWTGGRARASTVQLFGPRGGWGCARLAQQHQIVQVDINAYPPGDSSGAAQRGDGGWLRADCVATGGAGSGGLCRGGFTRLACRALVRWWGTQCRVQLRHQVVVDTQGVNTAAQVEAVEAAVATTSKAYG